MPSGSFLGKLLAFPYTLRICVLALLLPEGRWGAHFEWIINECTRELITKLGVHWGNIEELLRSLNRNRSSHRIKHRKKNVTHRLSRGSKCSRLASRHLQLHMNIFGSTIVRGVRRSCCHFWRFARRFCLLRILNPETWEVSRLPVGGGSWLRWIYYFSMQISEFIFSPTGKMLIFKRLAEAESDAMVCWCTFSDRVVICLWFGFWIELRFCISEINGVK